MRYYDLKQMINETRTSKSTIYRFYRKNEELKAETKLKGKRMYPEVHVKYFNSELLFDENKWLLAENKSMRNLIECLADKDSFPTTLWYMDWTFFYTVSYKLERNKKSCYRQMSALYDELINEFGEETEIRIFFTTEAFTNRVGYHNHFVIYIKNERLRNDIVKAIETFFSYDIVQGMVYDKFKAALFYTAKEGLHLEDWDIFGNNLSAKEKVNEN